MQAGSVLGPGAGTMLGQPGSGAQDGRRGVCSDGLAVLTARFVLRRGFGLSVPWRPWALPSDKPWLGGQVRCVTPGSAHRVLGRP